MVKKFLDKIDIKDLHSVSGLDATFLYGETPTSPMHVGSVCIVEGSLKFETFKKTIQSRIHMIPNLRKKLVSVPFGVDYPYWADDPNFNIELHIQHVALPQPGSWKELRALASSVFSEPLDRTRPLWSYTFVEGLNNIPQVPPGSVALINKMHHVAIDGMAGANMLGILFDLGPNDNDIPPPKPFKPKALPNEATLIYKSALSFTKDPFRLPKIFADTVKATLKTGVVTRGKRSDLPTAPFTAPQTPLNGIISAQRLWNAAILDFDRVKALKNIMGTTLNDVILAICAGALRRYLIDMDKLPLKPLVAMVPISVREKSDTEAHGNQISAMLVQLPTNIEDPIERLETIHENTMRGKTYQGALGAKTLSNLAEAVPFGIANQAAKLYSRYHIAKLHAPVMNLTITNVPGPNQALYIQNHKLLSIMGMAPIIDGMGLIITIFSYNGLITISPTTDANSMPDVDLFTRYIRLSANWLEEKIHAYDAQRKEQGKPGKPESDILFEKLKTYFKNHPKEGLKGGGIFQFNIVGANQGKWTIDFTKDKPSIRNSKSQNPDVEFTIQDKHLMRIAKGELDITSAFVQGRLEIKGDNDQALAFGKLINSIPVLVD